VINNGINVAIITLFAYVAWQLFGSVLSVTEVVFCVLFATFFIVFFGEVLPKVYAHKQPLKVASRVLPILNILRVPIKPVAWLLSSISNFIDTRYMTRSYNHAIEELHHTLDLALTNEDTTPEERRILRGVVN